MEVPCFPLYSLGSTISSSDFTFTTKVLSELGEIDRSSFLDFSFFLFTLLPSMLEMTFTKATHLYTTSDLRVKILALTSDLC